MALVHVALVHGTPLQAAERLGLRSRGSGWGEGGGGTPYGPSEQRRGLKVRCRCRGCEPLQTKCRAAQVLVAVEEHVEHHDAKRTQADEGELLPEGRVDAWLGLGLDSGAGLRARVGFGGWSSRAKWVPLFVIDRMLRANRSLDRWRTCNRMWTGSGGSNRCTLRGFECTLDVHTVATCDGPSRRA